ncbi:CinA family protein, partial [Apilactobacillus apinorum]|uniref:CinA family protein n=1 Tax=Apilactobacillus apinorum TaxID=1218495 RepID=UPI00333FBCF8
QACGVVSSEVAIWMAQQSRQIMNTNIGVSFTGVAGPDGLEGHSAGTVFIGLDYDGMQSVKQCHFEGTRQEVREQSVAEALELLKLHLK